MASPVDFRKDFLTCNICYDIYNTPKSLPCLHTFCLTCLSSYIIAEDDNFGVRRKKSFPCPICRALTRPPMPQKPLELWAADFKTNFYIENLMSAFMVKGSKTEQTTQYEKMLSNARSSDSLSNATTSEVSPPSYQSVSNSRERTPSYDTYSTLNFFPDPVTSFANMNINSRDNVHLTNLRAPTCSKSYELTRSLSSNIPGDKSESRLSGICLVDDTIAVLDFENNRIKTFFNWRAVLDINVITSSLDLQYKPRSLTKISNTEVAVTVPSRKLIYVIRVTPVLQIASSVKTSRRYKSIAESGSGSLIAIAPRSHYNGPRFSPIDILDYHGITLKSVDISFELKGLEFSHIAVSSSGLIHLVDSIDNAVYCVTQDGIELYRYQQNKEEDPFGSLNGLCCPFSDLYLTDFDGNGVYEIKSDCSLPATREKIISAKDGIRKPTDVHVEPDGTIFVACWDGFVRVYSLKERPSIMRKPTETDV